MLEGEILVNFMRKFDYISGSVLFLFAVILFLQSRKLPFGGEFGMGAGFFPLIVCTLLGFLGLVIVFRAWFQTRTAQEMPKIIGPKRGKFLVYLASFFAFGLFFTKVGYSLTLAVFLIFIIKVVEKQSWKITLLVTIISIIVSYVLFGNLLSVPLPEGILSYAIQRLK
jgi:hypothetical protein